MLISDVIMTDLNGIDAAIRIREMLPTARFCSFPDRPLPPISSTAPAVRATNLRSSPSPYTHRICSPGSAARRLFYKQFIETGR